MINDAFASDVIHFLFNFYISFCHKQSVVENLKNSGFDQFLLVSRHALCGGWGD